MFKIAFLCPGYENLGIESLAGALQTKGYKTRLFFDPILFDESGFLQQKLLARIFSFQERILRELEAFQPDMVCFSVMTDNYEWASRWAKNIRKVSRAKIVFGGIHPTAVPDKVIQEPFVDYVCIGEGDAALVDLTEAIAHGGDDKTVRNIWSKDEQEIHRNSVRPVVQDLDGLSFPDKDIFDNAAPIFRGGYLIATSRGCAYACSYCCHDLYRSIYGVKGSLVRRRSVQNVIDELLRAKEVYSPRHIAFIDDCFNSSKSWLLSLLREYKQRINLPFSCYVFPDLIDQELVAALKSAGCVKVQMGVQVLSEHKRETLLGRPSRQARIAEAIDLFKQYQIFVVCDAIFGFPDECEEDLVALVRFYLDHPPDHCENFWLRYYPRTRITQWARESGYIDGDVVTDIELGKRNWGLIRRPESRRDETYARQIIQLLMLMPFMPRQIMEWWLGGRRYRKMPVCNPVILYVIVRIFHHPKFDLNTERTWRKYLYFMYKRFLG